MGQSSLGCEALPPLAGLCLYLKNAVMVFSLRCSVSTQPLVFFYTCLFIKSLWLCKNCIKLFVDD